MIDQGILCDYNIHVPIFTDDPTNENICKHLLTEYLLGSTIIYCNSQKEGKLLSNLLNKLKKNSSKYIDCNTTKSIRNDIINNYKNGNIKFLVNVRILIEGFDAPITQNIVLLHIPHSKTTLIQIIGRALRKYPNKTYANIILPFSSDEDETSINNFITHRNGYR